MKYSTILIALLLIFETKGQTLSAVVQSLRNNSYKELQLAIKSTLSTDNFKQKSSYGLYSRILIDREIVANVNEEVLTLHENIYADSNSSAHQVNEYRLQLLTKDTLIIFYNLTRKTSMYNEPTNYVVVDSFSNLSKLKDFADSFSNNYHAVLKKEDLFNISSVFGTNCDYAASPTELFLELLQIKESKNYKKLDEWLTSVSVERQLMAIWELHNFKKIFPKITSEQKRLIELVKQKKGFANVCYGCSYTRIKICDIIERIEGGKGI